jgi:hypothetical protein
VFQFLAIVPWWRMMIQVSNNEPLVEECDKELREQMDQVFNSAERQEVSKNNQCKQGFVNPFNNPAVYDKQTGRGM